MDSHDHPQGKTTSTRCRYCGSETHHDGTEVPKCSHDHYQVVVACGSCGHPFAAFSRN